MVGRVTVGDVGFACMLPSAMCGLGGVGWNVHRLLLASDLWACNVGAFGCWTVSVVAVMSTVHWLSSNVPTEMR